mmetsp:Transcript_17861/g.60891  ORF Transcript_17861/g.60891 Transcript_17861/m.60891 type:complete len:583 (+) Transcript_17861:926-2674(+)
MVATSLWTCVPDPPGNVSLLRQPGAGLSPCVHALTGLPRRRRLTSGRAHLQSVGHSLGPSSDAVPPLALEDALALLLDPCSNGADVVLGVNPVEGVRHHAPDLGDAVEPDGQHSGGQWRHPLEGRREHERRRVDEAEVDKVEHVKVRVWDGHGDDLLARLERQQGRLALVVDVERGLLVDEAHTAVALHQALDLRNHNVGAVVEVDREVVLALLLCEELLEAGRAALVVLQQLLVPRLGGDELVGVAVALLAHSLAHEGKKDVGKAADLDAVLPEPHLVLARLLRAVVGLARQSLAHERCGRNVDVAQRVVDLPKGNLALIVLVVREDVAEHEGDTKNCHAQGVRGGREGDVAFVLRLHVQAAVGNLRTLCDAAHERRCDDLWHDAVKNRVLVLEDLRDEGNVGPGELHRIHPCALLNHARAAPRHDRLRPLVTAHRSADDALHIRALVCLRLQGLNHGLCVLHHRLHVRHSLVDLDRLTPEAPAHASEVVVGLLPVEGLLDNLADLRHAVEAHGDNCRREPRNPLERDREHKRRRVHEEEGGEVHHVQVLVRDRRRHDALARLQRVQHELTLVVQVKRTAL